MDAMASQITSLAIVCSTVYSGIDQRKHQSSSSLAFVRGIHRWPVNSPHKGRVTWKRFLMTSSYVEWILLDPTSVQSSLWLDPCYMRAMKNGNVSMMTSSNGKVLRVTGHLSPVTGEFPSQMPVTRRIDVFFDLRLNKRLRIQSRGWWVETLSRPLWRHCNEKTTVGSRYNTIHCSTIGIQHYSSNDTCKTKKGQAS